MRAIGLGMIATLLIVSACGQPRLRDLRPPGDGPDEFIIAPRAPLQAPENFTDLPTPTPGGANRTDVNPRSEAIAALGGQAISPNAPVPSVDAGLVSYASRNGVSPDIRATLAEEDAAFRKRRGRFSQIRLIREDRYLLVYERFALDPFSTANRFRRAGIDVPASPPRRGR